VLGSLVTTSPPATTTSPAPSARRLAGWHARGDDSAYSDPKEHLGLAQPEECARGCIRLQRSRHAADLAPHRPGAATATTELSRARYGFRLEQSSSISRSDLPERAAEYHDENLPGDIYKEGRIRAQCAAPSTADAEPRSPMTDSADLERTLLKAQEQSKQFAVVLMF